MLFWGTVFTAASLFQVAAPKHIVSGYVIIHSSFKDFTFTQMVIQEIFGAHCVPGMLGDPGVYIPHATYIIVCVDEGGAADH